MVFFAESNWPASSTCAAGKSLTASGFSTIQMARSSSATKTARRGFHSGCPTEAPPRQHFCTQSGAPDFVCLAAQASSLIQPARDALFCCADSGPSATRLQPSKKIKTVRPLIIIISSSCLPQLARLRRSIQLSAVLGKYGLQLEGFGEEKSQAPGANAAPGHQATSFSCFQIGWHSHLGI